MANRRMKMGQALQDHPQEAALLGAIVARWNVSEDLLSHLFGFFVGSDPFLSPRLFGALKSGNAKITLVAAAGHHALVGEKYLTELNAIVEDAQKRWRNRNKYAHSVYATSDSGKLFILKRKENWIETQKGGHSVTQEEMQDELIAANALFNRVNQFLELLHRDQPLSPMVALHRKSLAQALEDQPTEEDSALPSSKDNKPQPPASPGSPSD